MQSDDETDTMKSSSNVSYAVPGSRRVSLEKPKSSPEQPEADELSELVEHSKIDDNSPKLHIYTKVRRFIDSTNCPKRTGSDGTIRKLWAFLIAISEGYKKLGIKVIIIIEIGTPMGYMGVS